MFLGPEANPFIERPFTLISGVLTANSPQLLVSFCYLAYNNLFTRLQMAREVSRLWRYVYLAHSTTLAYVLSLFKPLYDFYLIEHISTFIISF